MWYSARFRSSLFLLALVAAHHESQAQQAAPATSIDHEASSPLAARCCAAPLPLQGPEWMFQAVPAPANSLASLRQLNPLAGYAAGHHLRLMPAFRSLPTGLADRPDRPVGPLQAHNSAYSLVGAEASYRFSHTLRATSNWSTGVGRYSVSPGGQFALGVAVKY